jgi:proline iminopeptidase
VTHKTTAHTVVIMLPSHYFEGTSSAAQRQSRPGNHPSLSLPPPSLCVTGAMSRIGRYTVKHTNGGDKAGGDPIVLSYIIFRPRQLHSQSHPPLVCLHGGPSIPSNYMLSIVNTVTDRSIVFYDQYGCGKSSRPSIGKKLTMPFSIHQHVEQLRQLLQEEWKLSKYHLLGHSWGGILAFEFLKQQEQQKEMRDSGASCCCSLVLSSTPTSASLIEAESQRLHQEISKDEKVDTSKMVDTQNQGDDSPVLPSASTSVMSSSPMASVHPNVMSNQFHQTHECRLPQMPLALIDSLAQVGPVEWRGIPAIGEWRAQGSIHNVPTLVLRGEYDFCTTVCIDEWREHVKPMEDVQYETLSNCSHYSMMEDERQYGQVVTAFLHQHEIKGE